MISITQEKGITLVVLVVTIIVTLILAGVSISVVSGEKGIMKLARETEENQLNKIEHEKELENKLKQKLNITPVSPNVPEPEKWQLASVAEVGDVVQYPCSAGLEQWTIFYNENGEIRLIPVDIFTSANDTPITIIGVEGYNNYEQIIETGIQVYYNKNYADNVRALEYSITHNAIITDDTKANGDDSEVQIDDITPLMQSKVTWSYQEEIPIFLKSKYVIKSGRYVRCLLGKLEPNITGKKVYNTDADITAEYAAKGNILPVVVLKQGILTSGKNSEGKWVLLP